MAARGLVTTRELKRFPNGRLAKGCGIVTRRQQPSTAHGTIFASLQDATGYSQVILWRSLPASLRGALLGARLLEVHVCPARRREAPTRSLKALAEHPLQRHS